MADIYHDLWIKASIDQVFEAISEPSFIDSWWTNHCEGCTEKDGLYRFYFSNDYDWYAKVNELEINKHISWTMTQSDADWDGTILDFLLLEENDLVHLQFAHLGWKETNLHFRRTSYCWAMYLRLLKRFIEKGEVVPFDQRNFV